MPRVKISDQRGNDMDENTAGRERVKNGTNNDKLIGIRYILTATVTVLGNRGVTGRVRGCFPGKYDGRMSGNNREETWGQDHVQARA